MAQDPSLNDEQLESEIRLVGDLVLAASQSDARLPQDTIDAILGLDTADPTEEGAAPGPEPGRKPSSEPGAA